MRQGRAQAVACALGFFSIGLGLAEILAPRLVRRIAGMRVSESTIRLYGVREIATGVGILVAGNRAPWIWARVAGDALDIASARRPAAIGALAGVTAVDAATALALRRDNSSGLPFTYYDYGNRSGFPRPVEEMRGIARAR